MYLIILILAVFSVPFRGFLRFTFELFAAALGFIIVIGFVVSLFTPRHDFNAMALNVSVSDYGALFPFKVGDLAIPNKCWWQRERELHNPHPFPKQVAIEDIDIRGFVKVGGEWMSVDWFTAEMPGGCS